MDSVHSDWRPQRHVCYMENLAVVACCLHLEFQVLFWFRVWFFFFRVVWIVLGFLKFFC